MNDPVLRVIEERSHLIDAGLRPALGVSFTFHGLAFVIAWAVVLFAPRPKILTVVDGFVVQIPRGGGGVPAPEVALPVEAPPAEPAPAARPAAPVLIKPEAERVKKGLTPKAQASTKPRPTPRPILRPASTVAAPPTSTPPPAPSAPAPQGLALAPQGPGAITGTDALGDLYLGGVQRRIWARWQAELRTDAHQPVTVSFRILASGAVESVEVVLSSGSSLIDRAAQRAVLLAAPFSALPASLGKDQYLIHASFRPLS